MKTLFVDNLTHPVVYDPKRDNCYEIDTKYEIDKWKIKYMYVLPEDMQIKTRPTAKQDTVVKIASKGDVLVQFVACGCEEGNIAVIKNTDFCKICNRFIHPNIQKDSCNNLN